MILLYYNVAVPSPPNTHTHPCPPRTRFDAPSVPSAKTDAKEAKCPEWPSWRLQGETGVWFAGFEDLPHSVLIFKSVFLAIPQHLWLGTDSAWKCTCSSHVASRQLGCSFQQNWTFQPTWKRSIKGGMDSGLPPSPGSGLLFVFLVPAPRRRESLSMPVCVPKCPRLNVAHNPSFFFFLFLVIYLPLIPCCVSTLKAGTAQKLTGNCFLVFKELHTGFIPKKKKKKVKGMPIIV